MKENYDEIKIRTEKGRKAKIKAHADKLGESTNSFINHAIDQAISGTPPEMALEGPVSASCAQGIVVLPSNTIEAVKGVSEVTGEVLNDYVTRAVDTQVVRDRQSMRMGINPATGEKLSKGGTDHE